ncbi:hypothetical protein NQ317_007622, partial [Molorchus minor]
IFHPYNQIPWKCVKAVACRAAATNRIRREFISFAFRRKKKVNQDLDLFVCSSHFQENDYKRDLKSELLNLPPKKILNENALPSLNLPDGSASQLPIQPPKLVPLTVQGNTNIPPVGLLIYQYNVPGNAQVGNNNITANPNSQVIVENTTENALKAKLVQLKADLKGEKVKYTLLKRKMRELKDKAAELHTSSAETLRAISDGKTNESFNGSNLIEPISKFTIKKKKICVNLSFF